MCRLCGQHSGISINIFDENENHIRKINAVLPIMVCYCLSPFPPSFSLLFPLLSLSLFLMRSLSLPLSLFCSRSNACSSVPSRLFLLYESLSFSLYCSVSPSFRRVRATALVVLAPKKGQSSMRNAPSVPQSVHNRGKRELFLSLPPLYAFRAFSLDFIPLTLAFILFQSSSNMLVSARNTEP